MFRVPTFSATTSRFLDTSPNVAVVTNVVAAGNTSSRARNLNWSHRTGTVSPWLRLTSYGSANLPNPIVDFSQSIRFDIYSDRDLKVGLGLRETDPTNAIGADGGTSGTIEFVGAPSTIGSCPLALRTIATSNWVTLMFNLTNEAVSAFTGNGVLESTTAKGVLEHLAFVPAAGLGAYKVYLDNIAVVPPSTLAFGLSNAPAGASINATNGAFTWTPAEAQGPGTYHITVRVSKNGSGSQADAQTFAVTVNEANQAPVLTPITDKLVDAGRALLFTNIATDADWPANTLVFGLDAAPADATIGTNTGVFSWVAPSTSIPLTNPATVRVTDCGSPPLSDIKSFNVIVVPPPLLSIPAATNGDLTFA